MSGVATTQVAHATTGTITLFSTGITDISPGDGASPVGIVTGPDGNLWFTEEGANFDGGRIGKITPNGVVTEFSAGITPGAAPSDITVGSDGNMWFTEPILDKIGRITTAGVVTQFPLPTPNAFPLHMTTGPDGNVWFSEVGANRIGRITPTGVVTEFPIPAADVTPDGTPQGITTGSDGEIWFAEFSSGSIGRVDPATGAMSFFPVGPVAHDEGPVALTNGPDGNLWVSGYRQSVIWRVTPTGVVTNFPVSVAHPLSIVTGAGGNLWFTDEEGTIGRMTPDGTETEFTGGITPGAGAGDITTGPDGNLWFGVGNGTNTVGRLEDDPQHLNLTLAMSAKGQKTVSAGSNITYNVTVTNNAKPSNGGSGAAPNVSLVDTLPAGAVFQSVLPGSANCSFSPPGVGGGTVTCSLGALADHSAALVSIVVRAFPASAGKFTNSASVFSSGHPGGDNSTASVTTKVTCPKQGCPPALGVVMTASGEDFNAGTDTIAYLLTVTNEGVAPAANVTLVDTLPSEEAFVSTAPASTPCTFQPAGTTGGTVTCALGTLAPHSTTGVTLNAKAFPPKTAGEFSSVDNTVSVFSGPPGPKNPALGSSLLSVNILCLGPGGCPPAP